MWWYLNLLQEQVEVVVVFISSNNKYYLAYVGSRKGQKLVQK